MVPSIIVGLGLLVILGGCGDISTQGNADPSNRATRLMDGLYEVTLKDGTRCLVTIGAYGTTGISCDWHNNFSR